MTLDVIKIGSGILRRIRTKQEKQKEEAKYKKTNDEVSWLRRQYRLTKDWIKTAVLGVLGKWNGFTIACNGANAIKENPKVTINIASIHNIFEESKSIYVLEKKHRVEMCCPEYLGVSEERIEKYTLPEIRICTVENARIIGQTNIILDSEEKSILSEIYYTSGKRAALEYGYFLGIRKERAYYADPNEEFYIKKGIYLIHPGNYNYYHFLMDTLSRLVVADYRTEYHNYPLLLDECVKRVPNYVELLNRVKGNHDVIWIKKNHKYKVEELVYASSMSCMPTNFKNEGLVKNSDYILSPQVLLELKKKVVGKDGNGECNRRIYLSRKDLKNSRLVNEQEVENEFRRAGFEIVHPELLSIAEQIILFNSARVVVGVTGGALTNIVFCQPGTILGCIIPKDFHFHMYANVAYHLGMKNIFLDAKVINKTKYISTDSFVVDLNLINSYVEKLVNGE